MAQPPKHISLARIHDVYNGSVKKTEAAAENKPNYQTTQRFAREAGHTGVAPTRPLAPGTRKGR
jgi:hypothetical protein